MKHAPLAVIALTLAAAGCNQNATSKSGQSTPASTTPASTSPVASPVSTTPPPPPPPSTSGPPWRTSLLNVFAAALAVDPVTPSVVYAATDQGVQKTTDAGATWKSTGLTALSVALAIDPMTPATIFAGTASGVSRSMDGGASWTSVFPAANVHALAIDPRTPANVYVGGDAGALAKSTDRGATWSTPATGIPDPIVSIAIDPTSPATLYLATARPGPQPRQISNTGPGGLWKSTDGGATWTDLRNGLADMWNAVVVDPHAPGTLYAATDLVFNAATGASDGLVAKSIDAGATWTQLSSFPSGSVQGLVLDPVTAGTVYTFGLGGVMKSTDAGSTWQDAGDGLVPSSFGGIPVVTALAIDAQAPLTLYASSDFFYGIEKTTTGGQ